MPARDRIFIHLPAYRDPELVPTIESALRQAAHPERLRFGICRQFNPADGFDDVHRYRSDERFRILDVPYREARGLGWARAQINDRLLSDVEFVLQLDSHHRFAAAWDDVLCGMYTELERDGYRPLLTGYLPSYSPGQRESDWVQEPWQQQFDSFYPHGTIFIRPGRLPDWQSRSKPARSRFVSGHFAFARAEWASEVKHDPEIYFSGEELNLTVRSYTHGWDLFHPHRVVIWHSTARTERTGVLKWDDDGRRGVPWGAKQDTSRRRVRILLQVEQDDSVDLAGHGLGQKRMLREYEKYAGIHFRLRAAQKYTRDHLLPPNPFIRDDALWEHSFLSSARQGLPP